MTETADDIAVPRSVGRVLDLFEYVLANDGCTLTAAATATGLTPTTALRHLRALESRGYVHRAPAGNYSAGPTIVRIAASLRDDGPIDRLVRAAQRHLDALAEVTGESVYLAVSDGRVGTYVAAATSRRAIRHVGGVGQVVDLDGTALGAAFADPGAVVCRTGAAEPDITAMSLALAPSNQVGWGLAVSVVGPEYRFGRRQRAAHTTQLRDTAARMGRDIGITTDEHAS